jgi:transglutaminase-like putative cysteine protease
LLRTPGPREIELTYLARLASVPEEAKEIHVWIPLAETGVEQEVFRREIDSPVPYSIRKDPEFGNDILSLTLRPPIPQPLEIAIHYQARLWGERGPSVPLPLEAGEKERYLRPEGLVIVDDEVRRRTLEATAGRPSRWDKARGIYDHVIGHMRYDKTIPGYGRGDTARACSVGAGNCTDFHSLFISMARADRIPSRFKIGFIVPSESSGIISGYHCWAEFYAEGKGWTPVDASEAWKHPDLKDHYFGAREGNRFLVSFGRNIQLVPPPQNGPANILFYPYVEVDGRAFDGVATEFRFKERTRRFARSR